MKIQLLLLSLAATLFGGCQASRTEALERRQDRYDARSSARQERRDIRSDRADARYGF